MVSRPATRAWHILFHEQQQIRGLWFRDFQQGQGTMYYYNGDVYNGNWEADKREGYGEYKYANGAFYRGEWSTTKKTVKASSTGTTVHGTTACGKTTNATVKVRSTMPTGTNIPENGGRRAARKRGVQIPQRRPI